MKHLIKFKSFEEINDYTFKEFVKKKFDPQQIEKFLQEYSDVNDNPYKPGIYRFKSFKQARKHYQQQLIKKNNRKR